MAVQVKDSRQTLAQVEDSWPTEACRSRIHGQRKAAGQRLTANIGKGQIFTANVGAVGVGSTSQGRKEGCRLKIRFGSCRSHRGGVHVTRDGGSPRRTGRREGRRDAG